MILDKQEHAKNGTPIAWQFYTSNKTMIKMSEIHSNFPILVDLREETTKTKNVEHISTKKFRKYEIN